MKRILCVVFFLIVSSANAQPFEFGPKTTVKANPVSLVISEYVAPGWLSHSFRVPYYVNKQGDDMKPTPRYDGGHPMGSSFLFAGGYIRSPDKEDWRGVAINKLGPSYVINLISMKNPKIATALVINPIKMENDPTKEWYVFRWRSNGVTPDRRAYFGYKEEMKSILHNKKERQKYLVEKYLN